MNFEPLQSFRLWLAKDLVTQYHLPWQSATIKLSPGRVAQSMLSLLIDIGTPASAPKSLLVEPKDLNVLLDLVILW
jgi:hypothetical protein